MVLIYARLVKSEDSLKLCHSLEVGLSHIRSYATLGQWPVS